MEPHEVTYSNLWTHFMISAIGNVAFLAGSIRVVVGGAATCGIGCHSKATV